MGFGVFLWAGSTHKAAVGGQDFETLSMVLSQTFIMSDGENYDDFVNEPAEAVVKTEVKEEPKDGGVLVCWCVFFFHHLS